MKTTGLALMLGSLLLSTMGFADEPQTDWIRRLANDGTLPLRFSGASERVSGGNDGTIPLSTRINLMSISDEAAPNSFPQACSNRNATKHKATGSVVIDQSTFVVQGICYDATSDKLELIGTIQMSNNRVAQSRLSGTVPVRGEGTTLSGRMKVEAPANVEGRYLFDVSRIQFLRPNQ